MIFQMFAKVPSGSFRLLPVLSSVVLLSAVGMPGADSADQPASNAHALLQPMPPADALRPADTPVSREKRTPFHWNDGDHVVLLGSTFLEREQQFGHVEAALSGTAGHKRVTFRNLGWDADTVFAESRGIFDSPEAGYARMIEQVRAEKPTVILICYGQNDAITSDRTADQFRQQLLKLIDDLSPTNAVMLVVSPHEFLPTRPPVPSPTRFHGRISAYTEILRSTAAEKSLDFVDLFHDFTSQLVAADRLLHKHSDVFPLSPDPQVHPDLWASSTSRWTSNGMHFNNRGYKAISLVMRNRLMSVPTLLPVIRIDVGKKTVESNSGQVKDIQWDQTKQETVRFDFQPSYLDSLPVRLEFTGDQRAADRKGIILIGTNPVPLVVPNDVDRPNNDSPDAPGLLIPADPQYQLLLSTVVKKNELYFHRWRPQNITYLFGFRKHEQGNNAVEITQFDPLVKALEDQIQNLQQPAWRTVIISSASAE